MDIRPEYVRSSKLNVDGLKSTLILDICKEVGATVYIAGPSGKDYLDMKSFGDERIKVVFNDFVHPVYPQRRISEFIDHLSAIDLIMNCGFAESKKIIMNGWPR